MMLTTILFVGLFCWASASEPLLNTLSGPIRGTDSLAEGVDAFLGVPFAEPPVGDLRFAKPVPKRPWTEVHNATLLAPPCAQFAFEPYYFVPDASNMSEDCLYLNLWVPRNESTGGVGKRPVVVFIHGGGFSTGTAGFHVYDGSRLAARGDLVVVTINYRLGAFGFFLAGTEEAPGNMGMHDQIMAIQWVRDNAPSFGGDPDNIVLAGQSAGAYSISILMVSPLSRHLFRRAILQSGSAINPLFTGDGIGRLEKNSQSVSSIVGCARGNTTLKTDPGEVLQCLKRKPMREIADAEKVLMKSSPATFFPRTSDELLPKSVVDLYREGQFRRDVQVLAGVTSDEGTILAVAGLPEYLGHYGHNRTESMTKLGAASWFRTLLMLLGQKRPVELLNFYLSSVKNRTSGGYIKMLADLLGDAIAGCGLLFLADFVSLKGNPVFFYQFAYRAASTPTAEWVGVTHTDELQYVFGNPFHRDFTDEELQMSHLLMDRWSAFARTGSPNVPDRIPWLRYSFHHRMYLTFGQEEETVRMEPNARCGAWRKRFGAGIDAALVRSLRNSGMSRDDDDDSPGTTPRLLVVGEANESR